MGRVLMDLVVPAKDREAALKHRPTVLAGETIEVESDVCDKDGRVFPVSSRMRPVPPGDGIGPKMYVVVAVDISARREAEAALLRHVEAQQEVVNLGRLALKGGCLNELFDQAVGAAARVLSGDCAQLFECSPARRISPPWRPWGGPKTARGSASSAKDRLLGEGGERRRAGHSRGLGAGAALSALARLLTRGIRSSVCALVGDPGSPFGVLAVHFRQPGAVPADCVPFLEGLANALAEAIQSRNAQEAIRHQALYDGLTGLPTGPCSLTASPMR